MTVSSILRVGDKVLWFPFGSKEPREAVVSKIEIDCKGGTSGRKVTEASWNDVHAPSYCVVDLTNGRWAHGYQIKPIDPLDQLGEQMKENVAMRLKEGGAQ